MNSVTYDEQINQFQQQNQISQLQLPPKRKAFASNLQLCVEKISQKIEHSWKDFMIKYDQLQQLGAKKGVKQQKIKKDKTIVEKKQKKLSNTAAQIKNNKINNITNTDHDNQKPKYSATQKLKSPEPQPPITKKNSIRARSTQNSTQLKSLKKTNEIPPNSKNQQQQKKAERLKQIMKRKLQLMEKLKKIDSQLIQVKRQNSPLLGLDKSKNLYLSNLNKSYISNLSNSRANNMMGQNVVEQHSKAIEKLERINNQKIKRQEKIAEQFKKKQQIQLRKLQQLQKQKFMEQEQKRKKNQQYISKFLANNKSKDKLDQTKLKNKDNYNTDKPNIKNKAKLNHFSTSNLPDSENSLIPTTMVQNLKITKKKGSDSLFLDGLSKKSSKNLLTERDLDFDADNQIHEKNYDLLIREQVQEEEQNIKNNIQKKINAFKEFKNQFSEQNQHQNLNQNQQQKLNNNSQEQLLQQN